MSRWQFYRHMPVFLANGKLLGRVEEIGHAVDYINVRQGHLLFRDWYIPIDLIEDVTATGIKLKVDRRALRERKLMVPPESFLQRQGATPGYEYTSPSDVDTYRDNPPADMHDVVKASVADQNS